VCINHEDTVIEHDDGSGAVYLVGWFRNSGVDAISDGLDIEQLLCRSAAAQEQEKERRPANPLWRHGSSAGTLLMPSTQLTTGVQRNTASDMGAISKGFSPAHPQVVEYQTTRLSVSGGQEGKPCEPDAVKDACGRKADESMNVQSSFGLGTGGLTQLGRSSRT